MTGPVPPPDSSRPTEPALAADAPGSAWIGTLAAVFLAGLLVLFVDAFAFRSGLYDRIAEPQSMGGRTATLAHGIQAWSPRPYAKRVLLVGDSRTQENCSARAMEAAYEADGRNVEAVVAALPGTELLNWTLLLRAVDPGADRFDVIAFGVSDYDAYSYEPFPVRDQDVSAAMPLLHLSDRDLLPRRAIEPAGRGRAAVCLLLKGYGYRRDLRELINGPARRVEDARWWREHVLDDARNYGGLSTSLAGARYDRAGRHVVFPSGYPRDERAEVNRYVRRGPPRMRHPDHERRVLARLLEHYEGSDTRLVFYRHPRLPFVGDGWPAPDPDSPLRAAATAGRVTLLPEHLFDPLESPAFFADALHLNRRGRAELTRTLASSLPLFGG
ncbi:hypothetical protein K8I85_14955 [bacterium]|nr:hypothetical protein [bacterium]